MIENMAQQSKTPDGKELTRGQKLWLKLVEIRRKAPISLERARLLTASWKETEGIPVTVRRARAFEKIINGIPIFIDEEQLICGNYGSWPMAAEWRPEVTVEWVLRRFESEKGELKIPPETATVMQEIAEYWKDKAVDACYWRYIGKEEEERMKGLDYPGALIRHLFQESLHGQGWCIPDYPKVIRKGFSGILEEIEEEIRKTPFLDASRDKRFLLDALVIVIRAGIQYARRHAALAREMARTAEPKRKAELLKMAEICEWVPANPARTFWEALQTMWFCNLFIFLDTKESGVSPGRVDQYLYPYYQKDVEEGRITREEAIQLLELMRCHYSSFRALHESSLQEKGAGEANWFNCMLGGQTPDGKDATNEMSYLWLEAAMRVRSPHPTLSVRVHENMNDDFAMKAAELCRLGLGYPAWFGDRTTIPFLMKNHGISLEEARGWAISGCTITSIPGKSRPANVFFGNIPKMFELALDNGVDPRTGKQLGPQTGKFEDFNTYEELYEAYRKQVRHCLEVAAADHNRGRLFSLTVLPHLVTALLFDDCIKRGQTAEANGCVYQQGMWYLLPSGPIDVADSLAAIKKCVYEDKVITKKQLMDALAANFEGEENQKIRRILLAAPKYGNDDDYVDLIARDVYAMLDEELARLDGPYGVKYVDAPHSVSAHGNMGRKTGALPSGRLAWTSLSDGNMSPNQGMDKKGPTAVILSAGKIDQLPMQGSLLNMKFLPSSLKTKEDLKKFLALIKTYLIDSGGKHIQFNVVDRATLLDAQSHPEQYHSLVIRVAGYSALWVELDRVVQDEIIARTEQTTS